MVQAQAAHNSQPAHPAAPSRRQRREIAHRIGMHTSIAGGVSEALELAHKLRCTTLQIFTASPRMWIDAGQSIGEEPARAFRERRRALDLDPVVIHANYLVNLAAPDPPTRERSIRGFHGELRRAAQLDADFLVVHPGSRRESTFESAVERIADSLRRAATGVSRGRLRILIENTAGQGTAVGWRLEEVRAILDACPELDLGVCLDTAHLLAAGYDIKSKPGLESTLEAANRIIGLDAVRVIHVNDSKAPFGARVDRHDHLGRGHIGLEAFRRIVNHRRLQGRAFILETPIDRPGDDWRNVRTLWRLAGIEWRQKAPNVDGFPARRSRRVRKPKQKR
jgi:deoxyribonuclease-4